MELGEGGGLGGLGAQPVLQGLLEPFDLALGLRVVRLAVLLGDVPAAQFVLEAVAAAFAARQAGGEHHPVVGQRRGRGPVAATAARKVASTIGPVTRCVGGDRQRVAGVVIEPGQDLGAGAVGERVVGEVGLPALVRLLGFEPNVGGLRPLRRVRGDQAGPGQDPADRRRRHPDAVVVFQVPGDGLRPGVQALPGQLLAQPHDQLRRLGADRVR